jgi:hypothetical protein
VKDYIETIRHLHNQSVHSLGIEATFVERYVIPVISTAGHFIPASLRDTNGRPAHAEAQISAQFPNCDSERAGFLAEG